MNDDVIFDSPRAWYWKTCDKSPFIIGLPLALAAATAAPPTI